MWKGGWEASQRRGPFKEGCMTWIKLREMKHLKLMKKKNLVLRASAFGKGRVRETRFILLLEKPKSGQNVRDRSF